MMSKILSYGITASLMAIPAFGFLVLTAFFAPEVFGHDESFIVRSDSMEPELKNGDLIFTNEVPPSEIRQNDIITFRRDHENGSILITHRVVQIRTFEGDYYYKTKGDNNAESDEGFTDESRVIGKVTDTYTRGGEMVDLFRSEVGLILIIFPSILVILKEFSIIGRELRWERLNKRNNLEEYTGKVDIER